MFIFFIGLVHFASSSFVCERMSSSSFPLLRTNSWSFVQKHHRKSPPHRAIDPVGYTKNLDTTSLFFKPIRPKHYFSVVFTAKAWSSWPGRQHSWSLKKGQRKRTGIVARVVGDGELFINVIRREQTNSTTVQQSSCIDGVRRPMEKSSRAVRANSIICDSCACILPKTYVHLFVWRLYCV